MFHPIAVFIGLRNVRAKSDNQFISFISLISALGMMIGVAVLITVLSVMNGFEEQLKVKVLGIIPQAAVVSSSRLTGWQEMAKAMQQKDSNIVAAAPFNYTQAMIRTANSDMSTIMLTGIVPYYEKRVSIVDKQLLTGNIDNLTLNENTIIIGKKLAQSLQVIKGDKVTLILPEATKSRLGVVPRYYQFTVVGIYQLSASAEKLMAYVPLETLNKILKTPAGAQGIRFKLDDIFLAPMTAQSAARTHALQARDWTMTNGDMFKVIRMQKAMISLILALIVVVASFNLVSSLIMVVTDKKSEIAILKTLGASRNTIIKIFVVQGSVIVIIGTVMGTILGIGLALSVGPVSAWVDTTFQLDLFSRQYVTELPSSLRIGEIFAVMLGSAVLAITSTIYPAIKAANITPIQGLKED